MTTWIPPNACADAVNWVGRKSLTVAWRTCQRADWMLWLVGRVCEQRVSMLCACECARTALRYVPAGEDRPRLAIEAAERWAADPTEINGAAADAAARAAGDAAGAARAARDAGDAARAKAHKTMCGLIRRRLCVRGGKLVERKPKGKGGKG